LDPDVWIDASTNWGIGIVMSHEWAAWKLTPRWHKDGRDISWAECIALELFILMIVERGLVDCQVIVQGDNTCVISAFDKGRS